MNESVSGPEKSEEGILDVIVEIQMKLPTS